MSGVTWKLDEDLKTVTITFPSTPPVAIKMDADGAARMMQDLGEFRARMKPEIPSTYQTGQKCEAVPYPAWRSEPELMQGNSVLHIRDPRFGWRHYIFSKEDVQKLIAQLQAQLNARPETHSDKLN